MAAVEGAQTAVSLAATGAQATTGFVYSIAQAEQIQGLARKADNLMKGSEEALIGVIIAVNLIWNTTSFLFGLLCVVPLGYIAYDKNITDMHNVVLLRVSSLIDENTPMRNVVCLLFAIAMQLLFNNGFFLAVSFLIGCVIKRVVVKALPTPPVNVALQVVPANQSQIDAARASGGVLFIAQQPLPAAAQAVGPA